MKKTIIPWGSLIPMSKKFVLALCMVGVASPSLASSKIEENNLNEMSIEQSSISVKGVIIDAFGDPLTGVSVVVEGTTIGSMSDIDGNFTISAPSKDATLIFSYVGFLTQKVKLASRTTLDITMQEDAKTLDEVVVTALGMTRNKKALGYALTELKGDDLAKSNLVSPVNALQGKVAGVQINMGSSGPQSSQRIIIRGNTSISGNNQPIFVIDGIIVDNEATKTGSSSERDFGNDLKNLNSDDFETVSVLKGAAATALYGSRASNGVILITTKQGKRNEGLGISVSHTQGWDVIYDTPDMQNEFGSSSSLLAPLWPSQKVNGQFVETRNIATGGGNFGPRFDGQDYTVTSKGYTHPYAAQKNNLTDLYTTGRNMNTNVAISGGTDKSAFRFSYSNMDTKGNTPNNTFTRNNFALNASHDIGKFITAKAGFTYVNSKTANPTYQGGDKNPIYDFMYRLPRDYDINYWKRQENFENGNKDGYNEGDPWGYTKTLYELLMNNDTERIDNYRANLDVDFKFTDWLKLTLKGDINKMYRTRESENLASNSTENHQGAKYEIKDYQKHQYRITAMLSANKQFGDFGVGALAAIEQWDTRSNKHESWTNGGLRIPGYFAINNSTKLPSTSAVRGTDSKRINSVFASVNTDWKNQIYFDITGRNDWASSLMYIDGSGNTSYFYPSFSLSWLATETFRDAIPEVVSFAKVRSSYAIVGQDCDPYLLTHPGLYKYSNMYTNSKWNGGDHAYYEFMNNTLGARDLKPEKQHAIELGVEARFLDDRIGFDFAYYKTNTKNQILALKRVIESGVGSQLVNAGDIQNSGIEFMINGSPIKTRDWSWDLTANITRNKNKIKELAHNIPMYELDGGGLDTKAWAAVGGAYGDIYTAYSYKRDDNGNKLLKDDGSWIRDGEQKKVGSLQPDFLAGLTSDLRWKNVSFGFVLDARFGGDILSGSYNYGMNSGVLKSSLFGRTAEYGGLPRNFDEPIGENEKYERQANDGMIPEGVFTAGTKKRLLKDEGNTSAPLADLSGKTYQWAVDNGYVEPVSAYRYYDNMFGWGKGIREESIHKTSWIALREMSLYWTMPSKLLKPLFVKGASLGFVVRNIGYLYNSLPDNIHPEGLASTHTSEYRETGGQLYSRNYSVKINLSF